METDGMTHTVGDKGLLARAVNPDAPTAHLCGAPGAQRLIQGILLIAESSANVWLYHPNIRPGTAQRLSYDTADDMEATTTMRPFSS